MTRIFIEDLELDIDKGLTNRITYAIDDLNNLDSKSTAFTKTIVLPGTANNNKLLGNIFEFNNSNFTFDANANVSYNFNAAKSAKCRIDVNGLSILKGVFRLLEIVYNGKEVEYECSVFGELGGFISKVGNLRLEDLDFSAYNQNYTIANINTSYDNANSGTGIYYPLVDIGKVSDGTYGTAKKDYQYQALRPALHVREYIDKIITNAGYTFTSDYFNTDFFKRLIVPYNAKQLTKSGTLLANVLFDFIIVDTSGDPGPISVSGVVPILTSSLTDFILVGDTLKYTATDTRILNIDINIDIELTPLTEVTFKLLKFSPSAATLTTVVANSTGTYNIAASNISFATNDILYLSYEMYIQAGEEMIINTGTMEVNTLAAVPININIGDAITVNDVIPKNIYQKDFFTSILKMFNLLVTEDKLIDKHLNIKPYVDFYDTDKTTFLDYSSKIDRSKQIRVKPMSEVNARFYELKYKSDTDFYNDAYKKLYNEGYGDRLFDNGLEFSKEKESLEVIFANAVLVGYAGEDKIVPTIFKKNNDAEERIDHVIRIMQAKKITGVASWKIMDGASTLYTNTFYGYAGHLDDPDVPNADICFGVPKQIYFTLVSGNLSNNLFNTYYSSYMAEITDKDSRLLQAMVKLNDNEIYNLDFSKFIYIDGGLYRLQKLIDYAPNENETTKAEFLRVIYTTY